MLCSFWALALPSQWKSKVEGCSYVQERPLSSVVSFLALLRGLPDLWRAGGSAPKPEVRRDETEADPGGRSHDEEKQEDVEHRDHYFAS